MRAFGLRGVVRFGIDAHQLGSRAGGNESYVAGILEGLDELARTGYQADIEVLAYAFPGQRSLRRILVGAARHLAADRVDAALFQYIGPCRPPCPVVLAVHDVSFRTAPQLLSSWLAARLRLTSTAAFASAAAILVPSRSVELDMQRFYGRFRDKVVRVPLAARRLPRPADENTVDRLLYDAGLPPTFNLYVGRRDRRKNVDVLVRAYALARVTNADLPPLVLLGPPHRGDRRLRADISSAGLDQRVVVGPYANGALLAAALARATVFCFPCRHEGFGLPVLEAMAAGCPVLAADEGALVETIGEAGIRVSPTDPAAWVEQLVRLAGDGCLRQELGEAGRHRSADFSWAATASRTIEVLENVSRGRVH